MTPLRQRMLDALILRGMAQRPQESYIDAVSRLARHSGLSSDTLNAQQVQQFSLHLLRDLHRSRSTVNMTKGTPKTPQCMARRACNRP